MKSLFTSELLFLDASVVKQALASHTHGLNHLPQAARTKLQSEV
jgi:hypothetical protein